MLGDKKLIESIKLQNFLSFGPDAGDIGLKSLNVLIVLNASGKSNPVSRLPWYGLQKYHNRANIKIEMPLTPTLFRRKRGIGG